MLDFTSALYLGLHHPSYALRPWDRFTTGRPAALAEPPGADAVARRLALLQGCERATLGPSTLHLFWDLFGILAQDEIAIYMDAGTYAIAKWGVERAAARGIPVRVFPHHDPEALHRLIKQHRHRGVKSFIVADGFCPGCGRAAPITAYYEAAIDLGGYLVLDDTQALGILGHAPRRGAPYGTGGGGIASWSNVGGRHLVLGSSLAKGFGVPVAVLSGSRAVINRFEANSETRVHCSPPSNAVIHAAEHALIENEDHGDELRVGLWSLVCRFKKRLTDIGLSADGGLFPVQTLKPIPGIETTGLHDRLLHVGIKTVLHRARHSLGARLSFLITARHTAYDIDRAVEGLADIASRTEQRIRSVH